MIKKLFLSTICGLFLSAMVVTAQSQHELSIVGGGGLSAFNYKTTTGSETLGWGGHVGLGYSFFFNKNFGLGTGAELTFYNSSFSGDFVGSYNSTDKYGKDFLYKARLNDYTEKQNGMFVNIPLMFQYQSNGENKFYAAVGGRLGIPVSAKFKTSNATLNATGYYEFENVTYGDGFEFMGFGNFPIEKEKGDLELKLAYMLSAEMGMKWSLNNNKYLYTGVYADYGLNNIIDGGHAGNFIDYNQNEPSEFAINSVLTAQYDDKSGNVKSFTEKVAPLAIGVKVKFTFGLGKKHQVFNKETEPIVVYKEPDLTEVMNAIDQLRDDFKKANEKAAQQPVEDRTQLEKDKAKIMLTSIDNFDISVTSLDAAQKAILDDDIAILKKYPDWKLFAIGYTCDLGAKILNKNIGNGRAESVKDYMVKNGIAEDRITTVSKGMSEPIVPNTDETNRRKNRRVEFVVAE